MLQKNRSILIIFLCISYISFSQSINDYRSAGNGNWIIAANWQVYNGTAWVAATNYPGQVAGTNDVTILGGNTIVLNSNIPNSFNSLTIGDNTGGIDRLEINADASLTLNTLTITGTGEIEWTRNTSTTLSLPAQAIVITENGGIFVVDNPCNANKKLAIGSSVYASCNGGGQGVDYEFEDINNGGGTLQVAPSGSSPICSEDSLNLFANSAGLKPSPASYSYSWTGTGPGGYTFSSTAENPFISSLTAVGIYIYEVTITDDDNSNYNFTESVDIVVSAIPNTPTSGGNKTSCPGATIPTLTASVGTGETVDWYDAAIGGNLLLSNNNSYTPINAGSYFAEARNIDAGCVSTSRTEIVLTVSSCKIITNRNITYRVRPN